MAKYSISKCLLDNYDKVSPKFIYNRFDLWQKSDISNVQLWVYEEDNYEIYFETLLQDSTINIGVWLTDIKEQSFKRICDYLFKEYKFAKKICFRNTTCPIELATQHNHFRIELPSSPEELDKRLSSKGRYNIKREKRILNQDFNSFEVLNFPALDPKTKEYWDLYFKFKHETYDTNYHLSAHEYCEKYHVTDIYVLLIGQEKRMAAIVLSCEQCENVYVENLTFDPELAKYSAGQVLYDEYLKALIDKGKTAVFLGGGDYTYKKRYGSEEQIVYSGRVYKGSLNRLVLRLKHFIKPIFFKLIAKNSNS